VVQTHTSQIQDGGQPPTWKNRKNRHISAIVCPITTKFRMVMHIDPLDCVDRDYFEDLKIVMAIMTNKIEKSAV